MKRFYPHATFLMSVAICLSASADELQYDSEIWRDERHDAANCLYVFAALHGVSLDYHVIEASLSRSEGNSFADIRKTTSEQGMSVSVYKTDLDGLSHLSYPIMVHLDRDRTKNGGFFLLFSNNDEYWTGMRGSVATIEHIADEDFRRRWSGYVLVPTQYSYRTVMVSLTTCCVVALYWLWRGREIFAT